MSRLVGCVRRFHLFCRSHMMWVMVFCMPWCCVLISGILAQAFMEFKISYLPLNLLMYWTMFSLVYFVTGRVTWSLNLVVVANTAFSVIEHYVYLFRGRHMSASDLMSIDAAMAVADRYDYTPDDAIILAVLVTAGLMYLFWDARRAAGTNVLMEAPEKRLFVRIVSPFVMVLLFLFFAWGPFKLPVQQFFQSSPGVLLNTVLALPSMGIDKPDGYRPEQSGQVAQLPAITGLSDEELPENIIIIMNESFADLSTLPLWESYIEDGDPYDRFHALMDRDDVTSGYTLVPVYGGNTAVSEWECLTGLSYNGISDGVVPFIAHMTDATPSLAKVAGEAGYTCVSVHAYNDKGWNRRNAYASLGFDSQYYDSDFPADAEHIRSFLSDRADFQFIEQLTADTDGRLFIHNVTMQNHKTDIAEGSDGDMERGELSVQVPEALVEKDEWLDDYCALVDETALALEEMFAYYDACEENTVILFFGDHWPKFDTALYAALFGYASEEEITVEDYSFMCRTPFLIYKNYGNPDGQHGIMTGSNYLGTWLLEAAGLPADSFWTYLTKLRSEIAAMNQYCVQDIDGNIHPVVGGLPDEMDFVYAGYMSVIYDYIKE